MGIGKTLKKAFGKKSRRGGTAQPGQDPLNAHALSDPLLGDDAVRSSNTIATSTASGSIKKVKYKSSKMGKGKEKKGFFKANAEMEDPMAKMSSQRQGMRKRNRDAFNQWGVDKKAAKDRGEAIPKRPEAEVLSQDEKHMAARAVTSSRVDKMLGTDVLTDERYARHDGELGVTSMRAKGEALRQDQVINPEDPYNPYQNHLDIDMSGAAFQKDMANLQLNDYLTGQVDRHMGNVFYDKKSGRARGIDNDLAFGDQFNAEFDGDWKGMAKHVSAMPKFVDAQTANSVMGVDLLDYLEMLEGNPNDPQRLTPDEVNGAVERMMNLQDHVGKLLAKQNGEDVDVDGEIVDEWTNDTFARQVGGDDSYIKRAHDQLEHAKDGNDPLKGVSRPGKKRNYVAPKA